MDGDEAAGLDEALGRVARGGEFCAAGAMSTPLPLVEVTGWGAVPLPFPDALFDSLAAHGSPAPYGRGQDTLLDPGVRRCLQIGADAVTLTPRIWDPILARLSEEVAQRLGVPEAPRIELYKLLLYREGDFFLPHRDSEKEDGMFGTLVVVLPSSFEGGELVVEHGGEARTLAMKAAPEELAWAAFYADCRHELRPLTAGVRLALVFNLCRDGALGAPARADAVRDVARALRGWKREALVWVLEHRYTEAGLEPGGLKGPDAGRAQVLLEAAESLGWFAALGMVSLTESWAAEQTAWDRYEPEATEPEDVELIELMDRECAVEALMTRGGEPVGLPRLPIEEAELRPEGTLEDEPSDEFAFHEATGNEGGTAERIYRRAAVVAWRRDREADVLARLLGRIGRPREEDVERVVAAWRRLADDDEERAGSSVVQGLKRIRWTTEQGPVLLAALLGGVPESVVARGYREWLVALRAERWRSWGSESMQALLGLADLAGVEAKELEELVTTASFDEVVVPAVVSLVKAEVLPGDAEWVRWLHERVSARAAQVLEEPTDWTRKGPGCDCVDCQALGEFMADPVAHEWRAKLNKERRRHMHTMCDGLDAKTRTERVGRPFTLVVTKTSESYERAVAQRAKDEAVLGVLRTARSARPSDA